MDKPPEFKEVVLNDAPPSFLESVINQELNPTLNKNWAKGKLSPEVKEVISRSRTASIHCLAEDPEDECDDVTQNRRRTLTESISTSNLTRLQVLQQHRRLRTTSMSPTIGPVWAGI